MLCRKPTPNDARALARLHVCAWQVGYRGLMPDAFLDGLGVEEAERRWSAMLAGETPSMLVAEEHGEILGACRFGPSADRDTPPRTAEIYSLNVDPSAWGQGIGRGLLTAAADRLVFQGFSRVTLWVIHGNSRARTLYERFGFAADGAERTLSARSSRSQLSACGPNGVGRTLRAAGYAGKVVTPIQSATVANAA